MHRKIPLGSAEPSERVSTKVALSKRNECVEIIRWRTERPHTLRNVCWAPSRYRTRGVIDCFSSGILRPIQVKGDSRRHIRANVGRADKKLAEQAVRGVTRREGTDLNHALGRR